MILSGLLSVADEKIVTLKIAEGKIGGAYIDNGTVNEEIRFRDAIVFPGLINSHDHLDFNCFPQLGNHQYDNYVEWGKDIHDKDADVIAKVQKIPLALRTQWGIYKNLINGITTVINHGAFLPVNDDLTAVFQNCHSLHSVRNEKNWLLKLNDPFAKKIPYTIHVGEGIDDDASTEIDRLIKWNILNKELIGIHGVGMTKTQAEKFKALVWCPASNLFLLGKTAPIPVLKKETIILFGTDSTLSAPWSIWQHIRIAMATNMADSPDILDMLTAAAARIWELPQKGCIQKGYDADLVIANKKETTGIGSFISITPEDILLVMRKGKVLLADEAVFQYFEPFVDTNTFSCINIGYSKKYIKGDLPALATDIKSYYPEAIFPFS